jgi:uncharacterized protein (DUF697 family)
VFRSSLPGGVVSASRVGMDPGQLVLPVAGIIAAAAVTFYVVSFQEMSAKSFTDYEAKIDSDDGPQTQLKSSMSSRKRREAKQASKPKPK